MNTEVNRMPENKKSGTSDDNHIHVAVNSYLDTSKDRSNKMNYDEGGSPYLDTSEEPSTETNYGKGGPYLNT
jgi:hypothetical protein